MTVLAAISLVTVTTRTESATTSKVQVIARGLEVPWALAFAPDGRLFVTERPGRIRVIREGSLDPEPVARLPVAAVGEGGLLGLALDPSFAVNGYLYVCYTAAKGVRFVNRTIVNRVARLVLRQGKATDERVLIDGIPGSYRHDGCRVKFGPDAKLYVTTGEANEPRQAQRADALSGKILRINSDGTVPSDNPFPGSPVYSLGHRNPQGLAWNPAGQLLAADHGPTGHDEINHILPGRNYGWPEVTGTALDARFVDPLIESGKDTWAPSGIAVVGDDLFIAALRGRRLLRVKLSDRLHVLGVEDLLVGAAGRLRDVVVGPDGALYIATSNRDGRGSATSDDDRILKIKP